METINEIKIEPKTETNIESIEPRSVEFFNEETSEQQETHQEADTECSIDFTKYLESFQYETAQNEPVQDHQPEESVKQDESTNNETIEDEPDQDEPDQDKTDQDEPNQDQPDQIQNEFNQEHSLEDNSVQEEVIQKELLAINEPVNEKSATDNDVLEDMKQSKFHSTKVCDDCSCV